MAPYYDRVVQVESRNNPDAVSPAGAKGRMQIMPKTGDDPGFGIKPWDGTDADNVRFGQQYLDKMHERYRNPTDALMAYNWGPGSVDKWIKNGRNPNAVPAETRNYVKQITGQAVSGQQGTGNTAMQSSEPILMQQPQQELVPVQPQANPNAPVQAQPLLREGDLGVLGTVSDTMDKTGAMQESKMLTDMVDANVKAKQAALLGPDAAQFAQQNNLAFNDPRVLALAADKNVKPLQKGLSFLQGAIGLPFGLLRNAALGENNDLTAAFTPEKTFRSRAQAAIAALDTMGITAKTEIAGMRRDTRQSLASIISPVLTQRATQQTNSMLDVGTDPANKAIVDYAIKNNFVDSQGNPDLSNPIMQKAALDIKRQYSLAEGAGGSSRDAALIAGITGMNTDFLKSNQKQAGELGVKAYEDITTRGRIADGLVPKLDFLIAQSQKFGNQYTGFTGDVRKWVQEAGAGLGIDPSKYKDLTESQVFDSVANDVGLVQAQRMPGTLAAQELAVALSIAGTYKDTAAARDAKLRTMGAGAKAEQAQRDAAMQYYSKNGNVFDEAAFRNSPEFSKVANRPLWFYDRKLLPTMVLGDRDRYSNFALVKGQVYVKTGKTAVLSSKLTPEQLVQAMGK
jgi:hypothetical protein